MNRRQFCRKMAALGGMLTFASLVEACRAPATPVMVTATPELASPLTPTPTIAPPEATTVPQPTEVPPLEMARVVLVKTSDRSDGVRRALALLDLNPARGLNVLLKPNLNSADEAPGSTHGDVLRTLVTSLNDMGARSITLGERSGMGDTNSVMRQKGVFDLAEELGFETIAFDDLAMDDWEIIQDDGHHWAQGFAVPRMLRDAECVVQTCNLKTHGYGGHFTISLKNSVGFVAKRVGARDYMQDLHNSSRMRQMIAEINTAYEPALIVVDGVEAFVDGGPDTGTRVASEVILAGTDRVAIDAVGVAILRLFGTTEEVSQGAIFAQEQIARAVELGLGVDRPERIELLTEDAASAEYVTQIREVLLQG